MSLRGWRLFGVAGTIIVYVVGLLILSIISLNKQTNQRPTTDELFKETDSSDIVKSIPNTTNQIGEIQSLKWCQPLRYLDSDDIKDITIKSTKLMQTFYGHDVRISKKYSQNRNGDHSNKSQCIEPIFEKASRSASNDEMKINYHEELWGNDLKALASFPGSGNTWLRYLLQQVTGIYTGSVYLDTELLKGGFSAENIVDSSVLVIKTHEWGPIAWKHFAKAILLVRDPGKAILAEFNRQTGGHIGFASPDQYNSTKGSYWQQFVAYQLCAWEQMNLQWAKNFTGEVEVIYYEDLEEDVEGVLRQILTFINYPLNEDLLNCALTRKKGIYHRKKPLMTFDPFTPEMHKAIEEKKREVYAELRR